MFHKSVMGRGVDHTLSDYIRRKNQDEAFNTVNAEKKLTFEEWYSQRLIDFDGEHPSAQTVWKAAQENAPSYRPGAGEK